MPLTKGRPSLITNQVVKKLEEAFKIGLNTSEACRYAGISRQIFYNKLEVDTEFLDIIDSAKDHLKLLALGVIGNHISKGDLQTAKWYLERKYKKEFAEEDSRRGIITESNEDTGELLSILQDIKRERISANEYRAKVEVIN